MSNLKPHILVTHIRPHLDDVCGIWLYRKYVPGWQNAEVKFIATNSTGGKTYGGKPVDTDAHIVHIGVCRGKYDEHKGNIGKSASLLVFEDLKRRKLIPRAQHEAARRVAAYVLEDDLGKHIGKPGWAYEFCTLLLWIPDSRERVHTGSVLLEALLLFMTDRVKLDHDWRKKKLFATPWGKGVGIVSTERGTMRAYEDGYVLVAQVDPKCGYRSMRAHANSRVNLTAAYRKVKKMEPQADWYLHHSKRMLICGSDVSTQDQLSKLTLDQLIGLIKTKR